MSEEKTVVVEDDRTGVDVNTLRRAIQDNLFYRCGNVPRIATRGDYYRAVAYTVRDRLMHRWHSTANTLMDKPARVVAYLSAEYLLGPHLDNALLNLGIRDQVREACEGLGQDLEELIADFPACRCLPSATGCATSSVFSSSA
jgi:starch phosphorylase